MLDLQEIRKNYQNFDDTRIKRIARSEAKGLREEVVPILIQEIEKRQLSPELIQWIKAERRKLSDQELESLKGKVKGCLCSSCRQASDLKGYTFSTITSFIIDESTDDYELILCKNCGGKSVRRSAMLSTTLGWWSLEGLIKTPFILVGKLKSWVSSEAESEKLIERFIQDNIGHITLAGDDPTKIQSLLDQFNKAHVEGT